ncbi:MAG: tRNA (adenosine(37)-N6)-threonylcarbamoyltransferase complex dimerization subunit type 1 TsaB [Gammaproteobacteria bacterium]|nr:tRNA (adenosine(37)-N6)-threonylcarbamoyltransferase complex dimerization subunit type 1 TsaB [Gammaproteobacteria bacterium]MBU1480996.1 tRNA (adenosine(37)-N6)-threonylcarbamoyltransferase complex dimerization subunit type 1 TsaB [Gammaproteobacteria bacterium]
MKILAVETSTEYCSVALWQDGTVSERCELVGQKHSEVLMEMLDALLKEAGVTVKQVDGIAFGKGPGSFTGVRIACGVAQGLALGADIPVVGICTLEAVAETSGKEKVLTALDARMGELYLAAYERRDGGWRAAIEPCLCKAEEAPLLEGRWCGAGNGFAVLGAALQARYDGHLRADCLESTVFPRAAAIAILGAAQFAQGKGVDAALALPLYLRDKVALKTSERDAVRSTSTGSVRTGI